MTPGSCPPAAPLQPETESPLLPAALTYGPRSHSPAVRRSSFVENTTRRRGQLTPNASAVRNEPALVRHVTFGVGSAVFARLDPAVADGESRTYGAGRA